MAKYKLLLPKMGESVAEATVIKWTKKPGDYVEADETVMEIATDKVDSDVPSPVAGRLVEQLYKDNDIVQVGAVIAIIETKEPEVIKEPVIPPMYRPFQAEPLVSPDIMSPVQSTPPANKLPSAIIEKPQPIAEPVTEKPDEVQPLLHNDFLEEYMPHVPFTEQLERSEHVEHPEHAERSEHVEHPEHAERSEHVEHPEQSERSEHAEHLEHKEEDAPKNGLRFYSPLVKNIAAQEGISNAELNNIPGTGAEGRLTKDDLLLYIQNKFKPASQPPVESTAPAVEPPAKESEPVPSPITPVAVTVDVPESNPLPEPPEPGPVAETLPPVAEPPQPEPIMEEPKEEPVKEEPRTEPVKEEPKAEPATEPVKPFVAETARQEPFAAEPEQNTANGTSLSGGDEIIEMDRMRRLIADHMVMSSQVAPHVTSFVEADVTNLVLWREKIKSSFEKREGQKITFTPIFIEAVVRAIKDYPMINVSVNGTQIIKKKDINISMATALPNGNLIVPVIKRADELNLLGLTKSVNDLANRARINKLKPDDVQGGTFTITNIGSFGNVMGTPIINQPQVAILAVGAIRKKPAVIETLQGDMIGIRHMMFLSLSYDHRVVDGALGGSFVKRVSDYLENWDPGREI